MNQDLPQNPRFCQNCGSPIQPGQRFCMSCGAQLPATLDAKEIEWETTEMVTQTPPPPPVDSAIHQPVQQAPPPQQPSYAPPPQPKKSSGGKTCLGCGCTVFIVILLVVGGLCLWGYNYYKDHQDELVENFGTDFGLNDDASTSNQDPETITWQGKTLRELAEENRFPSVTYNQSPVLGKTYASVNEGAVVVFSESDMSDTNATYIMTLTDKASGNSMSFNMNRCGCSIYHTYDPNDADLAGYVFVEEGGEKILVSNGAHPVELKLQ